MKKGLKYDGAVVPLVTPINAQGVLDEPALHRLLDRQIAGGVAGIFVLGTTGEGAYVPPLERRRLVEQTVARVKNQALVYAGLGDLRAADASEANVFLTLGADVVVGHPPITQRVGVDGLESWFLSLLDGVQGPLMLYNMPATTGVSIPLDAVANLLGHPRLAGIKDSENNAPRHEELMGRFAGKKDFSVFVGVGALMEKGLKLGADGIVPSVGNLIPEVCHQFCAAAKKSDWSLAGRHFERMNAVASLYQKGRNMNESLAALKAALHCRGLCASQVLAPLQRVSEAELERIRQQMTDLQLHLENS